MKLDILKIICFELILIIIGLAGIGCFLLERYNYFALTWGIAALIVFVPFNILTVIFFIYIKKELKK